MTPLSKRYCKTPLPNTAQDLDYGTRYVTPEQIAEDLVAVYNTKKAELVGTSGRGMYYCYVVGELSFLSCNLILKI